MLNINGERELAYLVRIDAVSAIEGYDRVELAHVGGWTIVVGKGSFKTGELAVYFEIDSKLPEVEPFINNEFLAKKHYKVKTQKMCKSYSQGLLMTIDEFGWEITEDGVLDKDGNLHKLDDESKFLTKQLGVIYSVAEDNKRKGNSDSNAKYKSMFSRHPKFAKSKIGRWCSRHMWAKKLLYIFWGKKKVDNAKAFPSHLPYITKSDEERVENIPFILADKDEWVKTTKIDGTSSLFLLERKPRNKFEYYVCSRNVRQLNRNQECYHKDNVYWEVNDKYYIEDCLKDLLAKHPEWQYVAIQGESAGKTSSGATIQGDPHKFKELRFFAYNFITSDIGRWTSPKGKAVLDEYDIPWVPIVDEHYILPDTIEEFKLSADGPCEAPGASGIREGYVYRRAEFKVDALNSFKNVSRKYLTKNN